MISTIFRNIPSFKGKKRLLRFISQSKLASAKNFLVKGKYGCKYYLPNLKEALAFDIYTNGIYEQETHDFLFRSIGKNAVFLDLGANIGSITIPLCKRRPDIKAVCVEAAPWLADYLKRNLEVNELKNVTCIQKALYKQDNETFKFFSPQDEFGKGSLSPVYTKDGIDVSTITVDTILREHGIEKVGLIKIDVEGYEYYAFKGAEKLLTSENAPDILFEFADWAENLAQDITSGDAQQFLKKCGYNLYIFNTDQSLTPIENVISTGNYMLFASKNVR
jgi:FkbM family methyltransferase